MQTQHMMADAAADANTYIRGVRVRPPGEPYTVGDYVRHARKFGIEGVFETLAQQTRNPHVLAEAVRELRTIDPKWQLPKPAAIVLAQRLVIEGYSEAAACRNVGIDKRTLRAHPQPVRPPIREYHADGSTWPVQQVPRDVVHMPKWAPNGAAQSGVCEQNGRPPTDDLRSTILRARRARREAVSA
jgi:hypothetical protein